MHRFRVLTAAAAAVALTLALPAAASAKSGPPQVKTWSTEVAAPFSIVADGSRVLVADGGTGVIGQLKSDGSLRPLVTDVPGLAGLAVRGTLTAYGSSEVEGTGEPPVITESGLNIRTLRGKTVYADVHAYEWAHNPDGSNTYGVRNPSACVSDAFAAVGMPANYTGLLDAHVYAVTSWKGSWLVADAGANAIFRVTDKGRISTVAVLPPVPVKITAEMAAMFGMPDCVVGVTYDVEPVPTGVTVGSGGAIYVSTLPGFPGESASKGAVWRIDPKRGTSRMIAGGLSGATSIAADGKNLYVAQLFGEGIAKVTTAGAVSTLAALPGSLAVAVDKKGTVWATTMDPSGAGPGSIVSISHGKVKYHYRR